jgi:hypothetical protein
VIQPPGDMVLLISGCNLSSGGLFVLEAGGVTTIDRLSTHGLAMCSDRIYRVIGCRKHSPPASDLLVYDHSGVRRFDRLDGVADPHDVLPRDGHVVISSSTENALYAIRDDGVKTTLWQATAPEDAWHLNCLFEMEGELYATAFGTFDRARGWSQEPQAPTGVLLRLPSEEIILRGLTQPHSPRHLDGAWLICNSALNELAAYDDRGAVLQRHEFAGYTRGIAFDERYLYVGESASRHIKRSNTQVSRITLLDRSDWSVVDSGHAGGRWRVDPHPLPRLWREFQLQTRPEARLPPGGSRVVRRPLTGEGGPWHGDGRLTIAGSRASSTRTAARPSPPRRPRARAAGSARGDTGCEGG